MNKYGRIGVIFALATSALFVLSAMSALAADRPYTNISGWVKNANTGLGIAGATVTGVSSTTSLTTTTNADGTYILSPMYQMTGTIVVTASHSSYITQSQTVTMVYHQAGHAYFSLVPKAGPYAISGTIQGRSYDYIKTYALTGATVTAKQETAVGQYTGVVYTAASGTGTYAITVAGDWMYHFTVAYHDHATYEEHLSVSTSQTRNLVLRCQWREVPQPKEVAGDSRYAYDVRIFERDVDGNGIIDSLNLFLDANTYTVGYIKWFMFRQYDDTRAVFWIELQGYKFGNSYNTQYSEYGIVPTAQLTDYGYYGTNQRMVLHVKINVAYHQQIVVPETDYNPSYTISAEQLIVNHWATTSVVPYPAFCAVGKTSSKLQNTLTQFQQTPVISQSNWPAVGDGAGIYDSMVSTRSPDTRWFNDYAVANLNSWPTDDRVIRFANDYMLTVYAYGPAGAYCDYNYVTYYQTNTFGFALDSAPYVPASSSSYLFADDFDDWEYGDWEVLNTGGTVGIDLSVYGLAYPSLCLGRNGNLAGTITAGHTFAIQTSHVYTEVRMRVSTPEPTWGGVYMSLLDSGGAYNCHISIGHGTVQWYDALGWHPTGASVAFDTWYTIGLDVDVTTKKFSLWINGVMVKSGMSFIGSGGHVCKLQFQCGDAGWDGVTVTQWLDDISVRYQR